MGRTLPLTTPTEHLARPQATPVQSLGYTPGSLGMSGKQMARPKEE